jgi:hypothetical protein
MGLRKNDVHEIGNDIVIEPPREKVRGDLTLQLLKIESVRETCWCFRSRRQRAKAH